MIDQLLEPSYLNELMPLLDLVSSQFCFWDDEIQNQLGNEMVGMNQIGLPHLTPSPIALPNQLQMLYSSKKDSQPRKPEISRNAEKSTEARLHEEISSEKSDGTTKDVHVSDVQSSKSKVSGM